MASERVLKLGNGRRLGFVEYGDPHGTPVFCFHGTPASRLSFEFMDAPARDAGIRILAPDRPGIGISPKRKRWTLLDCVDDTASLADALEIGQFGVLGWSGGGPYVLGAAHQLSERLLGAACCSGVGPIESPDDLNVLGAVDRLSYRLSRKAPWLLRGLLRSVARLVQLMPGTALKSFESELPESERAVLHRVYPTPRKAMGFFLEAFRKGATGVVQDFGNLASPFGFSLKEITTPVHFWQGDADKSVPVAHFQAMTEAVPNAVPHLCPGEGHLLLVNHVAEVLAVASGRGAREAHAAATAAESENTG